MFLPDKKDAIHKAWLYRVLTEIADDDVLVKMLYFKGGTYAAMQGMLDRFSVDLDFDFMGSKDDLPIVREHLENIFERLGLVIKDSSKKTAQYFLRYDVKGDNMRNTLKIDTFFPPLTGNKYEAVRLIDIDRIMHCQTIETMFSNKMIALIDRFKKGNSIAARDLYDVHHFFLNAYEYDADIIMAYSNTDISSFFKELYNFIDKKITQRMIDQDLNFLLIQDKFKKIRKILKQETLMLINDEIQRTIQ